jgi:hypothetical protein
MKEGQPARGGGPGHRPGRIGIHKLCRRTVGLGGIDGGVGGGVDHQIGPRRRDRRGAGGRIGQIGTVAPQRVQRQPDQRRVARQLDRDLPGGAEHQRLHAVPSLWPTPSRS